MIFLIMSLESRFATYVKTLWKMMVKRQKFNIDVDYYNYFISITEHFKYYEVTAKLGSEICYTKRNWHSFQRTRRNKMKYVTAIQPEFNFPYTPLKEQTEVTKLYGYYSIIRIPFYLLSLGYNGTSYVKNIKMGGVTNILNVRLCLQLEYVAWAFKL